MSLNLPNSPSVNDTFTSGDRTWEVERHHLGAGRQLDRHRSVIGKTAISP